jgi:hypothetical protein
VEHREIGDAEGKQSVGDLISVGGDASMFHVEHPLSHFSVIAHSNEQGRVLRP